MEPIRRFSTKAKYYHEYRPRYPPQISEILTEEMSFQSTSSFKVADIGSGTGILSELFLKNGNTVYGVEPNKEMREVAEDFLKEYPNFISVDGTAEATTINETIEAITAGQSFHWFDFDKVRQEFLRILKPNGYVILVWNQRKGETTAFGRDFEQILIDYGTDYKQVAALERNLNFHAFYGPEGFNLRTIPNIRTMSFEELRGRLLSISCIPDVGDPKYSGMIRQLKKVFSKYKINGTIRSEYDTELYFGQLSE